MRHMAALQAGRWEYSLPPLSWAVSCCLPDLVAHLLRDTGAGAGVDARDVQGRSAVHVCCALVGDARRSRLWAGAGRTLRLLLEGGASVAARTSAGRTPMHELFASQPASGQVHAGRVVAQSECRRELLRLLLDWGADAGVRDAHGWTVGHYCARRDDAGSMRLLLASHSLDAAALASVLQTAVQAKATAVTALLLFYTVDGVEAPGARGDDVDNLWSACRTGRVARCVMVLDIVLAYGGVMDWTQGAAAADQSAAAGGWLG